MSFPDVLDLCNNMTGTAVILDASFHFDCPAEPGTVKMIDI